MLSNIAITLVASAATVSGAAFKRGTEISVTPHEQYSSSIGVVGGLVNTNRVAYFPGARTGIEADGSDICAKISANGRSVYVLKIDSSAGAHDISYDAWNYLVCGKSATESPQTGGGIPAVVEDVPASNCVDLLQGAGGKLPLSAPNSMNFVASLSPDSWVAKNYELINIQNPASTIGYNEVCQLTPGANQATCAHQLGAMGTDTGLKVMNIAYGTGKEYQAL